MKPGHGSFITLEFGEPRLEIREPREAKPDSTPKLRELFARRKVTIRGEWHLWVYSCHWSIFNTDKLIGCSDDVDSFDAATDYLDGQALISATTDANAASQHFV